MLPDGVIGNTWAFGAHIPGSSPGRVDLLIWNLKKYKTEKGSMTERVAIILAAGISTRMNTQMAKGLHEVCGRPMLAYVLDACREVGLKKIYVVVGYSAAKVKEQFGGTED